MVKVELLFAITLFRLFAETNGLPVVETSFMEREGIVATSTSHEEGRAIDFSSKGWPEHKIREVVEWMLYRDLEYKIGAISESDGFRRLIIHHEHEGQGLHFHIQVSRDSCLMETL